jgi:hypothetical protein
MKKPCLLFISALLIFYSGQTQILPVKNSFQTDIAKVISEFPVRFSAIAGEQTLSNPQTSEYACRLTVKDALNCKVIRYSSAKKDIYSWEATMLKTDDFEEAEKKFRSLFNSLQHLSVTINGSKVVFKGAYEKPAEENKFTSVVFGAAEKFADLAMLKVELLMEAGIIDWTIRVLVYEKQKEDNERGKIID